MISLYTCEYSLSWLNQTLPQTCTHSLANVIRLIPYRVCSLSVNTNYTRVFWKKGLSSRFLRSWLVELRHLGYDRHHLFADRNHVAFVENRHCVENRLVKNGIREWHAGNQRSCLCLSKTTFPKLPAPRALSFPGCCSLFLRGLSSTAGTRWGLWSSFW